MYCVTVLQTWLSIVAHLYVICKFFYCLFDVQPVQMGAAVNISKYGYFVSVLILQVHVSSTLLYDTRKLNAPSTFTRFGKPSSRIIQFFCIAGNLDADRTCTINGLQPRALKVTTKTAVIVEENQYFDRHSLSGKYPYKCSFIVDAEQRSGIIAVVQEMKLRKDEETGECIDYVQVIWVVKHQ